MIVREGPLCAKGRYFPFEKAKNIRDQIPIGDRVIQTDREGHDQPTVFLPIFSPVDDRREKQMPVREFDVQ